MINKPTLIKFGKLQFMILGAPEDSLMDEYQREFQQHNVKVLVRTCEKTYNDKPIIDQGIKVIELLFSDGSPPPREIVQRWLSLVEHTFTSKKIDLERTIAIHCLAGLGRAPLLVAIALIENGLDNNEAIKILGEERGASINSNHAKFIMMYKRHSVESCCRVM